MSESGIHDWLVVSVLLLSPLVFLCLLFITAPYGRHARSGWGPSVSSRVGWLLMESPAVVLFGAIYAVGDLRREPVSLLLIGLWMVHYVYRSWIYPLRIPVSGRRIPVVVVFSGFAFNCVNAYINARWISHLGPYSERSMIDPWLWAGIGVFGFGWLLNQSSDQVLLQLRRRTDTGYSIPWRGAFRWISCPNYLGEIIEWLGWALAARSPAGLAFAVFTAANLVPRAMAHHRWYKERFTDYPRHRKALIPYLF